jgi:catechol 2,3-dioxygenase-like lactoylglutathione lyase family enzyme
MKLNHLDLQVPDVQRCAEFFEAHFGFAWNGNRKSPAIAILSGPDGFVLVLQRMKEGDSGYPEGFHLGFLVDDVATVHAQHERMSASGLASSGIIENNRGVMFYVQAPGDVTVEVSCRRVA